MRAAERELDRAAVDDEPFWIRFFTQEQLAAEFMYAAHDLGQVTTVQRYASTVLTSSAGMQRREVLAASALAASYLPAARGRNGPGTDIDMACKVLTDTLPSAAGLTSARGLAAINAVRLQLVPFHDQPAVKQVEEDFQRFVGAA